MKKVSVLGLGYVGLPTLVAISKTQLYETVGFDTNPQKITEIKEGIDPIADEYVSEFLRTNRLTVDNNDKVLKDSDVFIIAVPTPVDKEYYPDYGPVKEAARIVAKYLRLGCHVVLESTVNPGTSEEVILPILEELSGLKQKRDFNLAHCPERINPGDKRWTLYNIPRNIGSLSKSLNSEIADFYRTFLPGTTIHEVSSLKIAEATKIVENTFRDINIAYVNELAQSFDAMGIDLDETLAGASNKPFSFMAHWPGCGVGGHCIAVDPYYLIRRASLNGFDHRFLRIAREINNSMPEYTVHRLMDGLNQLGLPLKGAKILLAGLSYKADIGDLRESPALDIANHLLQKQAQLAIHEPYLSKLPKELSNAKWVPNLSEAMQGNTAVVIATAHSSMIDTFYSALNGSPVKLVVDGRNCLDKSKLKKFHILYKGIGRS